MEGGLNTAMETGKSFCTSEDELGSLRYPLLLGHGPFGCPPSAALGCSIRSWISRDADRARNRSRARQTNARASQRTGWPPACSAASPRALPRNLNELQSNQPSARASVGGQQPNRGRCSRTVISCLRNYRAPGKHYDLIRDCSDST